MSPPLTATKWQHQALVSGSSCVVSWMSSDFLFLSSGVKRKFHLVWQQSWCNEKGKQQYLLLWIVCVVESQFPADAHNYIKWLNNKNDNNLQCDCYIGDKYWFPVWDQSSQVKHNSISPKLWPAGLDPLVSLDAALVFGTRTLSLSP